MLTSITLIKFSKVNNMEVKRALPSFIEHDNIRHKFYVWQEKGSKTQGLLTKKKKKKLGTNVFPTFGILYIQWTQKVLFHKQITLMISAIIIPHGKFLNCYWSISNHMVWNNSQCLKHRSTLPWYIAMFTDTHGNLRLSITETIK